MQPIKIYSSMPKKNPLQIRFEDEILKHFQKKDKADIVNEILPEMNSKLSGELTFPITREQITKLDRRQLLVILEILKSPIPEVSLFKWSNTLFGQSRDAYDKLILLKQYYALYSKYEYAISISPFFYNNLLDSLVIAIFISVQKIFDKTKDSSSVTIEKLLLKYKKNYTIFPDFEDIYMWDKTHEAKIQWKWKISEDEIDFFETNNYSNCSKDDFVEVSPLLILKLNEWKLNKFKSLKKLDYLYAQRNKIYVHNDKLAMNNLAKLTADNPLTFEDFEHFINFSLKFTHFILLMLTNINYAWEPTNINDWEQTLKYTSIGLEKAKKDIKEKTRELRDEFNNK
ncbi:hypothetical protein LMG8520_1310 [Lactococcus lactis subsp. lactis]|uniref:HEPN AbiU2-like domain-containing protein n=2 Tax=Lactococcus lactis TaxID=1358 RepID=A0A2A5S6E8_LACLH|nr:hypothetical protein [Lactococcus lactis]KAA8700913.1 hypothetical protein F4V48_09665 [Lactococcus lactis subsp. hordniae]KSU09648.1 hypothetical protein LMG8520_1310 [Lactococcus lactis subsp. lactis]MCT3134274.1 hypothetical protein [Lactococcus lactis]PCS09089.1 hypothetical protein RU90_GL002417 [Lactococcus lactis subsp. hordniae]